MKAETYQKLRLQADGTPIITDMGNQWKCIYHTDRAMIECTLRIEEVLKAQ